MKLEEINCLIDAYQDGDIAKPDAIRLADIIRSGGSQSDWIMKELEMRGLIAHVFDETTSSRFVNSLMARFRAEPEGEKFEQDFKKRLGETERSRPNTEHHELKRAVNTVGTATEADGNRSQKKNSKFKLTWLLVIVVVGIGLTFLSPLFNREVGILKMSSRGLHVYRGNTEADIENEMVLYAGDRLSALGQGRVEFKLSNQSTVMMFDESSLVLDLQSDVLKKSDYSGLQSLFIEKGHVKINSKNTSEDVVILTPHAVLKIIKGQCVTRSSELSTMFELKNVEANLQSLMGSENKLLQGNVTILVNDAGQIEEHHLSGEQKSGK